jgi:leucyl-tRNA synthetase
LEILTLLIAPYATELADESWKFLWHTDDVHFHPWPKADETKIQSQLINLPIQVNGKVRWTIDIKPWLTESEVFELAHNVENVVKHLEGKTMRKIIWVQDKILNIIAS